MLLLLLVSSFSFSFSVKLQLVKSGPRQQAYNSKSAAPTLLLYACCFVGRGATAQTGTAQKLGPPAPSQRVGGGGIGIKRTPYAAFYRVFRHFCPRLTYPINREHTFSKVVISISQPLMSCQIEIGGLFATMRISRRHDERDAIQAFKEARGGRTRSPQSTPKRVAASPTRPCRRGRFQVTRHRHQARSTRPLPRPPARP